MKLKKYMYALVAVAGAFVMASCSDREGTEPGTDGQPVVTIYSLSVPSGYDSDVTCALRLVPNNQVANMYVFSEPQDAKTDFVAANGEQAYMDRVISEGTAYEGGSDQNVIVANVLGYYTTTVVAVAANGARQAFENVFKGVQWVDGGTATVSENLAGLSGTVTVQRQSDTNIFRVVGLYSQLDPNLGSPSERFVFSFSGSGDSAVCTNFTTSNAPFFLIFLIDGAAEYHGYYDSVEFGDYCNVAMDADDEGGACVVVSCLKLDNNAGSLYTGGQIKFYTSDLLWLE